MTKRNKIILVLGILFAFLLIFNNTTENKVKRYLKKKYKEEFIVEYIGKRNG